tara:strand:- start:15229 stop:15774 length:546 start_codon:yes stop_codon:yes gene_type:complete
MKKKLYLLFLFTAIIPLFIACVKDTDFSQTEDIVITPTLELDFLFFNLNSESFSDLGTNNLVVSDTTFFNFLNDEFTADNLIKADIYFKNTNSFPVDLMTQYKFLDENNELHYEILIPVNSGTISNPVITEHIEIIEEDNIINLTMAEKVVVNVIAASPLDNLDGVLNLQSKTTYYLRIEQ